MRRSSQALDHASCTELLARLPQGLDTLIGEAGAKLSGGERQRLSIARALLREPRLLIFDEATSALDSITEEQVTQTVRRISAERTQITLLIAHRLSTVLHADTIHVLEQGRIVESGGHAQLLARQGPVLRDVAPADRRAQGARRRPRPGGAAEVERVRAIRPGSASGRAVPLPRPWRRRSRAGRRPCRLRRPCVRSGR